MTSWKDNQRKTLATAAVSSDAAASRCLSMLTLGAAGQLVRYANNFGIRVAMLVGSALAAGNVFDNKAAAYCMSAAGPQCQHS